MTAEYIVRMPNNMPYEIKAELNAWYVADGPIVRCRDCKHMEEDDPDCLEGAFYCDRCGYVKPDGFCKWGERKSE